MRIQLTREVEEGSYYPSPWWGFAWYRPDTNRTVVAPIVLNVLFAAARRLWFALKRGIRPAAWEREQMSASNRAFRDGKREGLTLGHIERQRMHNAEMAGIIEVALEFKDAPESPELRSRLFLRLGL